MLSVACGSQLRKVSDINTALYPYSPAIIRAIFIVHIRHRDYGGILPKVNSSHLIHCAKMPPEKKGNDARGKPESITIKATTAISHGTTARSLLSSVLKPRTLTSPPDHGQDREPNELNERLHLPKDPPRFLRREGFLRHPRQACEVSWSIMQP